MFDTRDAQHHKIYGTFTSRTLVNLIVQTNWRIIVLNYILRRRNIVKATTLDATARRARYHLPFTQMMVRWYILHAIDADHFVYYTLTYMMR